MSGIGDYLGKRARDLGLERQGVLREAQEWLDQLYPGQAKAASLNDGVLKITTQSAAVAGELRLRQTELLDDKEVKKIQININ